MNKINILEFSHQRGFGGTDKDSQLMMQFYDREKFNVFACSYVGGPRAQWIEDNNIPNIITQTDAELVNWIKSQKIDVAHLYRGGWREDRDIWILKKAEVPIIIERNCFGKFDSGPGRQSIDKHVFCSNTSHKIYKTGSREFYDSSKCTVIYCPTDNSRFDKVNIDYSSLIFGRYSRKANEKWHEINIRSLPFIKKEVPEAKFYAIGIPDDYKELAKNLDVLDMIVEFNPPIDEGLIEFIGKISVFAHSSSIGESFGNTIAEAMAAGLPVVTHEGGDSAQAEIVTDGYNGFVVHPDDIKGYADRIIFLMQNPDQKEIMGKLGKERSKNHFDAKFIVKQFENLYIEQYKLKFGK